MGRQVAVRLVDVRKPKGRLQVRVTRHCRAWVAIGQRRKVIIALQVCGKWRHDYILHRRAAYRDRLRAAARMGRTRAGAVVFVCYRKRTRNHHRAAVAVHLEGIRYRYFQLTAVVAHRREARVLQNASQLRADVHQGTAAVRHVALCARQEDLAQVVTDQRSVHHHGLWGADARTVQATVAIAVHRYAVRALGYQVRRRAQQQRVRLTGL